VAPAQRTIPPRQRCRRIRSSFDTLERRPDLGSSRGLSAAISSRSRVRSKTLGALLYVAGALALITLAAYSSGGWQSPLSVFYLFVVVFCASYFSTGVAALCVAVTLLASLAAQLYAPHAIRMVECLAIQAPTNAGLVLACRYGLWERSRTQSERDSARIRALEKRLWHEASLDPLTGLYNRGRFEDRFEEEFERARRAGE
jgi:predicted signal transduction protein with EAL and GGDEF domain